VASATGAALLERELELEAVEEELARARRGEGMLLVIEGPAGVGKTELQREARASAERAGMIALEASGSELEQSFAFGVVRQLLEPPINKSGGAGGIFVGGAGPAARLFSSDQPLVSGSEVGFEALHSLYWLVVNLTDEAPLLVAVDDCQWADRDSLRFLSYLAQRIEGLPVAMLLAGRAPESGHSEAAALWSQVASRPSARAV
jgi:predicted ATPase